MVPNVVDQQSSSLENQTLTSLYSLRAWAHNLLRLALDSNDRAVQDRYLAAAREVLEQMEDEVDLIDTSLQLNTPEDALQLLEQLENGGSDADENEQEVEDEVQEQENGVVHEQYEDEGADDDDGQPGNEEEEPRFDDDPTHHSNRQEREQHDPQVTSE
ncbi:hypothetical protein EJ08DRAFT_731454 [Tothia fuscella]|uniref:Uncharacterized protein n=1 Tax=Tothia fuscella TaxID=1048955 RepID=A0A9P4U1H4_9PEZI|nr:hypothetical protein EJ08DRAFT_731454 [Tothia fuscella]